MSQSPSRLHLLVAPEEAAAEWLLRRDAGQNVEHDPDFIAWRDAAPENAKAWTHAVSIWEVAERPPEDDPLFAALRRDALQARPDRRPAWGLAAAAAVAVIAVGLAWTGLSSRLPAPPAKAPLTAQAAPTFAVAQGAPNSFTLPDGSRVTLNANSAIAVSYSADSRNVRLLRGQAFFSVEHDPRKPFVVAAGARTVTDLGTEFDMRLDGQVLAVTLAKGAIAVSAPQGDKAITLASPGQQLIATPGQADVLAQVDLKEALAWRTRLLAFSDTRLADAVAVINRYGGPPARVVDPEAAALPVTGQFRAGDPTRFAQALSAVYPLRVKARNDGGVDIASR